MPCSLRARGGGGGGHLNIKMSVVLPYRDNHVKDKTVSRSLTWESHTWERRSLYWDEALVPNVGKSSAAIKLTVRNWHNLVNHSDKIRRVGINKWVRNRFKFLCCRKKLCSTLTSSICSYDGSTKASLRHVTATSGMSSSPICCSSWRKKMWALRGPWEESTLQMPSEHYYDVIMSTLGSQITGISTVWSTVFSGADQRKHQSTASLAFVWEIHRWPVNSPHKRTVTRKMLPFDDVIMLPAWREHHRYCRTTLSIMPLGWISAITWTPDILP